MALNKPFNSLYNLIVGTATNSPTTPYPPKRRNNVKGYPTIRASYPTGSRFICDPPVMDTDDDTFVLVKEFPDEDEMNKLGWTRCRGEDSFYDVGPFEAYRLGTKNLILIENEGWYIRCVAATLLAKEMNLTNKEDRINLFSCVQGQTGYYPGTLPSKGLL